MRERGVAIMWCLRATRRVRVVLGLNHVVWILALVDLGCVQKDAVGRMGAQMFVEIAGLCAVLLSAPALMLSTMLLAGSSREILQDTNLRRATLLAIAQAGLTIGLVACYAAAGRPGRYPA